MPTFSFALAKIALPLQVSLAVMNRHTAPIH